MANIIRHIWEALGKGATTRPVPKGVATPVQIAVRSRGTLKPISSARNARVRQVMDTIIKGQKAIRESIRQRQRDGGITPKEAFILNEMLDKFKPAHVGEFIQFYVGKARTEILPDNLKPLEDFFNTKKDELKEIVKVADLSPRERRLWKDRGYGLEDYVPFIAPSKGKIVQNQESRKDVDAWIHENSGKFFRANGEVETWVRENFHLGIGKLGEWVNLSGMEMNLEALAESRKKDAQKDWEQFLQDISPPQTFQNVQGEFEIFQDTAPSYVEVSQYLQAIRDMHEIVHLPQGKSVLEQEKRLQAFEKMHDDVLARLQEAYQKDTGRLWLSQAQTKEIDREWARMATKAILPLEAGGSCPAYNRIPPSAFMGTPLETGGYMGEREAQRLSGLEGGVYITNKGVPIYAIKADSPLDRAYRECWHGKDHARGPAPAPFASDPHVSIQGGKRLREIGSSSSVRERGGPMGPYKPPRLTAVREIGRHRSHLDVMDIKGAGEKEAGPSLKALKYFYGSPPSSS